MQGGHASHEMFLLGRRKVYAPERSRSRSSVAASPSSCRNWALRPLRFAQGFSSSVSWMRWRPAGSHSPQPGPAPKENACEEETNEMAGWTPRV